MIRIIAFAPRLALIALVLSAAAVTLAPAGFAQQAERLEPLPEDGADAADAEPGSGPSLMERGADMFLRGLRDELDPALQDLRDLANRMGPALESFVDEMGPAMAQLSEQIEDWTLYEAPEMLPNGDILIRRREKLDPDAPESAPDLPEPGPGGEIEL